GSRVSESWLLRIGRPRNSRLGPSRRTLTPTATPQRKQRKDTGAIRSPPPADDACLNGFLTAAERILTPSSQRTALVSRRTTVRVTASECASHPVADREVVPNIG